MDKPEDMVTGKRIDQITGLLPDRCRVHHTDADPVISGDLVEGHEEFCQGVPDVHPPCAYVLCSQLDFICPCLYKCPYLPKDLILRETFQGAPGKTRDTVGASSGTTLRQLDNANTHSGNAPHGTIQVMNGFRKDNGG